MQVKLIAFHLPMGYTQMSRWFSKYKLTYSRVRLLNWMIESGTFWKSLFVKILYQVSDEYSVALTILPYNFFQGRFFHWGRVNIWLPSKSNVFNAFNSWIDCGTWCKRDLWRLNVSTSGGGQILPSTGTTLSSELIQCEVRATYTTVPEWRTWSRHYPAS